jgi:hypothetical protein
MGSYLEWNDALAAHFFRPGKAGQPVNLYTNEELISELGRPIGSGVSDFVSAVKQGPPWATRDGLGQRAIQALEGWRDRGLRYPPYIAYLCMFVLAAGLEGDFAQHSYYPRLRQLLQLPGEGSIPSFHRMYELWEDLDQWAVFDKGGDLGVFKARVLGGWIHVGYPIAQIVLSEGEQRALPEIFSRAALDPTSLPPAGELARMLRAHGAGRLRARTLRLLQDRHDEERYKVLLETVAEELAEWDGQVGEDAPADTGTRKSAALRLLCLNLDMVARRVRMTLRCKLNADFPDDRFVIATRGSPARFWCEEYSQGWSSTVKVEETGRQLDAAQFNWADGLSLRDERLGWEFKLPGRPVRIFVNGSQEGLPGLVEMHALQRSQPFYLIFQERRWPQLERWAQEECEDFTDHGHISGLPPGWRLASARRAIGDLRVRDAFPYLSLPSSVRLRFLGGIRSAAGNNFFAFAPPDVYVEGGDEGVEVWCHGQKLELAEEARGYRLPPQLPMEKRIPVEVKRQDRVLARQSLYMTGDFTWRWDGPPPYFDRWDNLAGPSANGQTGIIGATVVGEAPDVSRFRRFPLLATELMGLATRRIFFVGRVPGQIVRWPAEPLPSEWDPVWAIPMARRGHAIYCGQSLDEAGPLPVVGRSRQRGVDLWKEVLWHRRKRIVAPRRREILELWREFQEAARRV